MRAVAARNTSENAGVKAGRIGRMQAKRKVTIEVPAELLRRARRSTGEGITATVRRGLELVAARSAYEELRRLRGAVRLSIDVRALRQDRR